MKETCVDPALGTLLHGYELGMLSEAETESFEKHLLKCEYCFREVRRLENHATLLRESDFVESRLGRPQPVASQSIAKRLVAWLWPEVPLVFRPGLILPLLILLLYPAFLGLVSQRDNAPVGPVSVVSLLPDRAAGVKSYAVENERPVMLEFVCFDCAESTPYQVSIVGPADEVCWHESDFRDFDDYQTGRLLLDGSVLDTGQYTLTVQSLSDSLLQEYRFRITR